MWQSFRGDGLHFVIHAALNYNQVWSISSWTTPLNSHPKRVCVAGHHVDCSPSSKTNRLCFFTKNNLSLFDLMEFEFNIGTESISILRRIGRNVVLGLGRSPFRWVWQSLRELDFGAKDSQTGILLAEHPKGYHGFHKEVRMLSALCTALASSSITTTIYCRVMTICHLRNEFHETIFPGKRVKEVRPRDDKLLFQVDRGQASSKNDIAGGEKLSLGRDCL